jgi:23S rRNA pseudouridine2605 synthase
LSVGRLDANTEGLLLLTNDGGLARLLELPATGWTRRYRVRAHGRVSQERLDALRKGIAIDGVRYGPIEARLEREQGANVWLMFAMREGKNREVKNVLGHLGLAVNRLIRVSFGPFQLGDLPEGAVEEVRTRHLREQLAGKLAAAAGLDFTAPIVERQPQPPASLRHAEVPGHSASKTRVNALMAGPRRATVKPGPPSLEARVRRTPQDDGDRKRTRGQRQRRDDDHIGEPELARRERKRGRRPFRGKKN